MNDDTTTLETLRKFLSTQKDPQTTPVDVLQIIYLIAHKAEDHYACPSQQTLARSFGCDTRTILRSQERLARKGWIAATPRRGLTSMCSLNVEAIPAEEKLRSQVTDGARALAFRYQQALKKWTGRKRFPKLWLQHQFFNAQRMLDDCSGDVEKVAMLIGFALSRPEFHKKAAKSLYTLFARWQQVKTKYAESQRKETVQ